MTNNRLGELLVRHKLIDEKQLAKALEEQKVQGGRLGASLVKLGFVKEDDLASFLSKQYGVPSINLAEFEIDATVIRLIPPEVAQKYQIIPINRAGSTLIIAMSDPSNIFAIDDIKFLTGYNIEVVVASEEAIKEAEFREIRTSAAGVEEADELGQRQEDDHGHHDGHPWLAGEDHDDDDWHEDGGGQQAHAEHRSLAAMSRIGVGGLRTLPGPHRDRPR